MPYLLTKREKVIFYFTVATVIFIVCFNILCLPLLKMNGDLNSEIYLTKAKLKKYLQILNQKNEIQHSYRELAATFKLRDTQGDTAVVAMSELEELAKNSDVQIIEIRPLAPALGSALSKEFLIDLRTEGTIEGYLKFIYNLENPLSLLTIKKAQLTAKPNSQKLDGIFSIFQLPFEK